MLLVTETLEEHGQYIKRVRNVGLGRLHAYCIYGVLGMSGSSLHGESTNISFC